MIFAKEDYTPAFASELLPLIQLHYEEIAVYKDIPLKPDYAAYEALQAAGCLRTFTVRDGLGLAGYALFVVRFNPHYATSLQAVQDILYLSPYLRGGMTGWNFIKWCDDQLADEGVQVVYHHVKAVRDFGRLLERMGYSLADKIYARRLDR